MHIQFLACGGIAGLLQTGPRFGELVVFLLRKPWENVPTITTECTLGLFDFLGGKPSPEKFAKIMMDAAAANGIREPIRFDAQEFQLVVGTDPANIFNLHNAFHDYCSVDRKERDLVLTKYSASMAMPVLPDSFAEAKPKLMPLVRAHGTLEYLRLHNVLFSEGKCDPLAARVLSADADLILAVDTEHAIPMLNASTLENWGVSFDEAFAAALDNLRDADLLKFEPVMPGLFVSATCDSYEVSRIMFPDVVHRLDIGCDPVVMAPTRSRLLAASSTNPEAMMTMVDLAIRLCHDEGRTVSATMYRYQDGLPVEYHPAHPGVRARLADLRHNFLAEDYATQKSLLDKIHEKTGTDLFVASYQAVTDSESGAISSFAVWTEGVDTLLPDVDLVALVRDDGRGQLGVTKVVRWEEMCAAAGLAPAPEGGYPARYRVKAFPPPDIVAALEAIPL